MTSPAPAVPTSAAADVLVGAVALLGESDERADGSGVEARCLDAALGLVARWGVAKTSLADVAKAAGCSRATLYRAFPGGKQELFHRLGVRELASYLGGIVAVIDEAADLEEALTAALVVASRAARDHDAAQFILQHEPGLLLPFLGFHEVDRVYRGTAELVGPHLHRFLPADRAAWAAEWTARLFITFLFNPGAPSGDPADPHALQAPVDLADKESARRLVHRYLSPAFAGSNPIPDPARIA